MPKRKSHNPSKLTDRPQRFIYEIRIWSNTADRRGHIDDCETFAFPVEDRALIPANTYAFDFGLAVWAVLTSKINAAPETADRLTQYLEPEGIAVLEEIRDRLTGPCYGEMTRWPVAGIPGHREAAYSTVQLRQFDISNAVEAAERVGAEVSKYQ